MSVEYIGDSDDDDSVQVVERPSKKAKQKPAKLLLSSSDEEEEEEVKYTSNEILSKLNAIHTDAEPTIEQRKTSERKLLKASLGGVIDRIDLLLKDPLESIPVAFKNKMRENKKLAFEWFRRVQNTDYEIMDSDIADINKFLQLSDDLEKEATTFYHKEEESGLCMSCLLPV